MGMRIRNKKRTLQLLFVFVLFIVLFLTLFTKGSVRVLEHAAPDPITDAIVREGVERQVKAHFGDEDAILLDVYERYGDTYGIVGIAGHQYYARMDGETIIESGRY